MTTSGTGVWPGVGCGRRGGQVGVKATCLAEAMGVDGTGDAVVGATDEEVGGCNPQFV